MKRNIFLLFLILFSGFCLNAQLVVSEELAIKDNDIMAARMNDKEPIYRNGEAIPYAIVRVGLVEPNASFEVNASLEKDWVLKQEFKDNEYWVYLPAGVRSFTVKTKRFRPLHYNFPAPVEARNVYVMAIKRPDGEKYKGNLHISSNVPEAEIYVDGTKVSDGTPFTYTGDAGLHQIELKAPGYDPQTREIDIPMGQSANVTINLFAAGSLSVDGVGYGMVPVESTSFMMGSPMNYYTQPQRKVSLRPFSIGSTLVSVDLWEKVMGAADERIKGENGQVVNVSYDEIQDFISALNSKTGKEFRLPTEAEWEYTALNGKSLGISDIGSMMEWCRDWFGKYAINDITNPQGPEEGVLRVVRGGSEYNDADPVYNMPAFRWRKDPSKASPRISFRLVQDN